MGDEHDPGRFLRACRRQPVDRTPVWFMRQAGRSLPEYRRARGNGDILEAATHPELVTELTLQPLRRYAVDAAILFSDIMVPLRAIGCPVRIVPDVGPVLDHPLGGAADIERLRPLEPEADIPSVIEAVTLVTRALEGRGIPLIGFAGAPFTVACYLVEGKPSRTFARVKSLMHTEPSTWQILADRLADIACAFLSAQVRAGARAVQLFDSWAGWLTPADYERFVLPVTARVLSELRALDVPTILFGVGTGELLALMASAGPDVVGIDWRVPIDVARSRLGANTAVQGNLDPAICLAPWEVVAAETRRVLQSAGTAPGHIFNLGHGVLPDTDPGILAAVADLVHQEGRSGASVAERDGIPAEGPDGAGGHQREARP